MPTQDDVLSALSATVGALGPKERQVLLVLAKRLLMGQTQYGLLDPHDGRDWRKERAAEFADAWIYTAIQEVAETLP
jgi:hypothetical protein